MAQIKYLGRDTDNLYNDGDQVEQDILRYVNENLNGDYQEIINGDDRWPVFYHLTDMRENILNWYDFRPDADILEIGGGMGAITGLLCRKGKTVTTVELTNRRAEVIYTRHARYDNLTVLAGNFNELEFPQKYDYITLIGVLEYAPGFTPGGNPADFLAKIRSLLKPGGKILIAIENRFGLKYWCGAKEDHTGKVYDGINGYPDTKSIRTFSRSELIDLLTRCGLNGYRFYYPLPDYKLPQIIYSDQYLPKTQIPNKIRKYYLDDPVLIADEGQLYADVAQNNAFPFMANSFFVECGETPDKRDVPIYASFTPDRVKEYRTITVIRSDDVVRKYPMYPDALPHLNQLCRNQELYRGKNLEKYVLRDDFLEMPVIHAEHTLEDVLCKCIRNGDSEQAKTWIQRLYDQIRSSSALVGEGEEDVLENGFIDLSFGNCFISGDKLIFFDQEWMLNNISSEYILVRALYVLYWENPDLEKSVPLETMLHSFVRNRDQLEVYKQINRNITNMVFGTGRNVSHFFEAHRGCVDRNAQIVKKSYSISDIVCTVYFCDDKGYSEDYTYRMNSPVKDAFSDLKISGTIPIPAGCREIRIDPCEGYFCAISNLVLSCSGKQLECRPLNGYQMKDIILFPDDDPHLVVQLPDHDGLTVHLEYHVRFYSKRDPLFTMLREELSAIASEKEKQKERECKLTEDIKYLYSLCAEKDRIIACSENC